ncbi:hypothetical protein [Methylobacillus glycogenes]|uniref:hypothetical protein n=1 Tax=Methylobacillus glycogenes TaxID=406 RepID=UPI00046EB127|nr:hypothetical protein [Methylobacillus glycogenes]
MATDLALVDFFRPYILKGENTDWHAALSVIYVESFETALSDEGITIRGVARFSGAGKLAFDPLAGKLSFDGYNTEGHPQQQPGRREPGWILPIPGWSLPCLRPGQRGPLSALDWPPFLLVKRHSTRYERC